MKKIILILLIVLVIISCGIIWSLSHWVQITETYCNLIGGRMIYHSFSYGCGLKAKDAGNKCIYNSECVFNCEYPIPATGINPQNISTYKYPQELMDQGGQCNDYGGDEGLRCDRNEGEDVKCNIIIS